MSKRQFSPEQKLKIVKSGEKVGIRESARIAGVHFTSVYDWRNAIDTMGEEAFLAYKPAKPNKRAFPSFIFYLAGIAPFLFTAIKLPESLEGRLAVGRIRGNRGHILNSEYRILFTNQDVTPIPPGYRIF